MPSDGELVPRNARFWVVGDLSMFQILAPGGERIAFDVSDIAVGNLAGFGGELHVITPREPLAPGDGYRIMVSFPVPQEQSFDVSDEIDTTAPLVPEIAMITPVVEEDEGNTCGTHRGARITLDAEGVVFALYDADEELQGDPPGGIAHDLSFAKSDSADFWYDSACSLAWPGGGESLTLRFASFDLAGNLSGVSEPETIERPEGEAACAVALGHPRSPGALACLALLGGALFVRRRGELRAGREAAAGASLERS
jgi:hypothetical protein